MEEKLTLLYERTIRDISSIFLYHHKCEQGALDSISWAVLQTHHLVSVMLKQGYIGKFENTDDHRAGKIVNLTGRWSDQPQI
jgi:hypothetical protein